MSEKYNPKKPGKDILTSDKTDFRKKKSLLQIKRLPCYDKCFNSPGR